jgi:hypothetical protein
MKDKIIRDAKEAGYPEIEDWQRLWEMLTSETQISQSILQQGLYNITEHQKLQIIYLNALMRREASIKVRKNSNSNAIVRLWVAIQEKL